MKIAITGGTGFIGSHLAQDLAGQGHKVVVISRGLYTRGESFHSDNITFVIANVNDANALSEAFRGCDAVVHCAGTSTEDRFQTFRQVHIDGARTAIAAAGQAGVKKFVLMSYLHARPNINSAYHTTKWEGEEIVRKSNLNYTILKAGLVYGQGDHLLHNLGNLLRRLPVFATVGFRERTVRLIAVEDLVAVIRSVLLDEKRFARQTVAVVGPEEFPFSQAARRISKVLGRPFLIVLPFPVFAQRLLAWASERMPQPFISA
ncbi:MAG TPA: NAD(P)H-binding protein, partial [Anaerolineales bacterium]|nr:NAD(P)H-binding protein [Anaerolineales bacterium]